MSGFQIIIGQTHIPHQKHDDDIAEHIQMLLILISHHLYRRYRITAIRQICCGSDKDRIIRKCPDMLAIGISMKSHDLSARCFYLFQVISK